MFPKDLLCHSPDSPRIMPTNPSGSRGHRLGCMDPEEIARLGILGYQHHDAAIDAIGETLGTGVIYHRIALGTADIPVVDPVNMTGCAVLLARIFLAANSADIYDSQLLSGDLFFILQKLLYISIRPYIIHGSTLVFIFLGIKNSVRPLW